MALEDDNSDIWVKNLESAILENCSTDNIYNICQGRALPAFLRAEVWKICLNIESKGNQLLHFDEIFDLPQQKILREDCQQFVEKLGNEDEDKLSVVSDLESILTYYCKSTSSEYEKENGWIETILPLLALKLHRSDTYNMFEAIKNKYMLRSCKRNDVTFHLFRLLILYHDPELCSFLDTKKICPDMYCLTWFQSLFAGTCCLPVVLSIWDLYLQQADPFFVFFLSLVMVVNAREMILGMKNESKQNIVETLSTMPCALEAEDVPDFCSLAQYYSLKTPSSFRKDLHDVLFDDKVDEETISQALCLPVSAVELVENAESVHQDDQVERVRFFLVDCRPAEQYNAGHLPTAFHLDCNLMLQEPSAFSTAVQGLLSAQKQALAARAVAGGEHLCFLGSGRNEEDQYAHMVIASFLQKHTQYISMISGGYQAVHEYFRDDIRFHLDDHTSQHCLVCLANSDYEESAELTTPNSSSTDLFGKIGAAMRLKSAEVKEKLFDYIVNPSNSVTEERHVSSADKLGKRYRNMAPVFSIDDENDGAGGETGGQLGDFDEDASPEGISTAAWLKRPDTVRAFKCQEVTINGYMYDSNLIVTDSHLFVLRDIPGRKGFSHVVGRRPLSAIVKITSKKKHPELITFKYGVSEENGIHISDMDRFLIPKATEATKLVSQQILKQLKS